MRPIDNSEALSNNSQISTQIDWSTIKIDKNKLRQHRSNFNTLINKHKFSISFFDSQKHELEEQLLKQQLKIDHRRNLSIVDERNQKWFEPHERIGPYRSNFKKTLAQLKSLIKNQHGNLCMSYNKYTPEQIIALFHSLKQVDDDENIVKLGSLYLSWVRIYNIVHYLQFKQFTHLKIINIGGNFVESIELLCRVSMPTVEDVYLWNNNITDIKSLRRCNWPCLRTLDLHVNRIADLKDLRYLGNKQIITVIFDSNLLTNFNQAIVMCSKSPKSKIAATSNLVVKWMGRPKMRLRKRAIEVRPCTMKVRYI